MHKTYFLRRARSLRALTFQLCFFICCGFFAREVQAQAPVQVGTGTTGTLYGPLYIFSASSSNKYSYSMTVYSQADIVAAGGAAGLINQISWNKLNNGAYTANDASFEIFMKNTTTTGFTTASDLTAELVGATPVFSSTTYSLPATVGWINFPLSTSFNWNGTDNLMVITRFNRTGNATGEVRWEASTATASIKMSFSAAGTYSTHYIYNNRPNIKLQFGAATGIREQVNNINLAVWPNPGRNEMNLDFNLNQPQAAIRVTLTDLTGKTVLQDEFRSPEKQIKRTYQLDNVQAGVYLLRVETPEGTSFRKLIRE